MLFKGIEDSEEHTQPDIDISSLDTQEINLLLETASTPRMGLFPSPTITV